MNKNELIKIYKSYKEKMRAYDLAINIMSFDDSTIAPKKSLLEKSKLQTILSMEYRKLSLSEEYLNTVDELFNIKEKLSSDLKREIELNKKSLDRMKKIPDDLYKEYHELLGKSYIDWVEAKDKNNFSIFAPDLKRIIEIKKEFADIYGVKDNNRYNTLLDLYEDGVTTDVLDNFFETLKSRIIPLLKKIQKSKVVINDEFASSKVNRVKQLELTKYALKQIGFDFTRGAISETEHPFTNRITPDDVRITTHIYENMFFSNIFSTIHEGGHAIYEQNIDKKLIGTDLYEGTSCAVHESQSRFYENVIGRSEVFINKLYKKIVRVLPKEYKNITEEDLYLAANKVTPSLIRTEADELTYSLHIIIRYELEKMFINGDIDVYELPKLWNKLYKEYLGIDVPSDSEGILQDVHWSDGSFGYFPSYALGNAYSIQIMKTMEKDIDVFELIKNGKIKEVNKWLKDHVYIYGLRITGTELIKEVTKEDLNPEYYCKYLEDKFNKIYKLD